MSNDKLNEIAPAYQTKPFRSEFQPLIDQLYREEVLDARKMTPEEKFLAGEELFIFACKITLAGIESENPGRDRRGVYENSSGQIAVRRLVAAPSMICS